MQQEPMPVQPIRPLPPPLPPPSPSPRRSRRGVWITLGVLAAVGLGGAVVVWSQRQRYASLPPRVELTAEARRAEIVEAIATAPAEDDQERVFAIRESLLGFGKAVLANDTGGKAYLDVDRMIAEFERVPEWPKVEARERADLRRGIAKGLDQWFVGRGRVTGFDELQVRSIRPVADRPGEVVVYARVKVEDVWVPFRYWMIQTDRWRMYDFEELNTGIRISTLMSRIMASALSGNAQKMQQLQDQAALVRNAINGLVNGLYEETIRITDGLQRSTLPDEAYAIGLVARGGSQMWLGQTDEALKTLREAERLKPDSPMTMLYLSQTLLNAGEYEEALKYAQQYRDNLGASALGNDKIGIALNHLGRPDEALVAIEQGLDEEGDSVEMLRTLSQIRTPAAGEAFARRVAAVELPPLSVRGLLTELDRDGNADALEHTLRTQNKAIAGTIDERFFTAALDEHREHFEQAAAIFAKDIRTTEPHFASAVYSRYLWCMARIGKAREGYDAAPNRREAIQLLAETIRPDDNVLTPIIETHLAADPTDAVAWKAMGSQLASVDQFEQAVGAFDQALKNNQDPEATENIHWRRLYALHRLGKSLDTFATEYPWSAERFNQLAALLRSDADPKGLARVIELHRKAMPESPRLREWEGELAYLNKDWEKAVAIFKSIEAGKADVDVNWRARDVVVRSLYHLRRFDEARTFAGDRIDPIQGVLLDCGRGDTDGAIARIKTSLNDDYYAEEFLDDPDLALALQDKRLSPVKAYLDGRHADEQQPTTTPSKAD